MPYGSDREESRFLTGDEEALGRVSRWISTTLTRARFRVLRDEWVDLHQEILRRVIESLRVERFDPSRDFRVYVQSIAHYTARDAVVRKLRELGKRLPQLPEPPGRSDVDERLATRVAARQAMELMSQRCRGLFHLYFFEGRSHAEVAKKLDIPLGTVKSRLSRCLNKAREGLGWNRLVPPDKGH